MGEFLVGGVRLRTPVLNAAGVMGFGASYADYFDLDVLGALVTRSVTARPCLGNPRPRLYEAPSGVLHAVGFQNGGIDSFIRVFYKKLEELSVPVVLSLYGAPGELAEMCEKARPLGRIAAVEVNAFITPGDYYALGERAYYDRLARQVEACAGCGKPVWAKLMPMAGDIVRAAKAAEAAGARAAVCCNAFWAKALDPASGASRLSAEAAGLSGPAIKPIALFLAARVAGETGLDVVGCGGIMNEADAREYLRAGAKAVAVGSASFAEPESAGRIAQALAGEGGAWK